MELRHLRYFVAVAEEGSITNAAERRLHTAQPSLSRQIRDLELEMGVKLLERNARGIALTAAGRIDLKGVTKLICRRGDSNPHELPHTPLKRARLPVPPLRLVWERLQKSNTHFFAGDGEVLVDCCVAAGVAAGVACGVGVAVGVAAGDCSGIPDCNTDVVPLMNGKDKHNPI